MKSIFNFLFSVKSAVFFLLLLALSMAVGTFVENDYGTPEARIWIYNAWWFTGIFIFLICIFIYNIFQFKLLRRSKLPALFLHISFIAILIGAGVTRYVSQEGVMLIYENESENKFFSTDTYFQFQFGFKSSIDNNWAFDFEYPEQKLLLSQNPPATWWFPLPKISSNPNDVTQPKWLRKLIYKINGSNGINIDEFKDRNINIKYHNYIADFESKTIRKQFVFKDIFYDEETGMNTLEFVFDGMQSEFIALGQEKEINGIFFSFTIDPILKLPNKSKMYFNIFLVDIDKDWEDNVLGKENLLYQSNYLIEYMQMQNQSNQGAINSNTITPLTSRTLYSINSTSEDYSKNKAEEADLLQIEVNYTKNNIKYDTIIDIIGGRSGFQEQETFFSLGGDLVAKASFGSKKVDLPFNLYLEEFQLDYYPGTDAPESYASKVIIDSDKYFYDEDEYVIANSPEDALQKVKEISNKIDINDLYQDKYRIYMNNILNHGGYRFYQSSYGSDEYGDYTVLSVNQDFWGTSITYFGYLMLIFSVCSVIFSKKTRFNFLLKKLKKMTKKAVFLFFISSFFMACSDGKKKATDLDAVYEKLDIINPENPDLFNDILISASQEDVTKGRTRPFHTKSSELLRKIYGKDYINYIDSIGYKQKINSSQAIISMMLFPNDWYKAPIIKLGKHEKFKKLFNTNDKYISYEDFFENSLSVYFPLQNGENNILVSSSNDTIAFNYRFGFNSEKENDVNVFYDNGILTVKSIHGLSYMVLDDHNNDNYGQTGFVEPNLLTEINQKTAYTIFNNDSESTTFVLSLVANSKDKIIDDYEESFAKKPHLRSTYDKEILNLQERKSICEYIFSSILFSTLDTTYNSAIHLNFFPPNVIGLSIDDKTKTLNQKPWVVDKIIHKSGSNKTFFSLYKELILEKDFKASLTIVEDLKSYQRSNADLILPSTNKVNVEIFYNKINPFHFSRLVTVYLLLGFLLLTFTLLQLFYSNNKWLKHIIRGLKIGIYLAFIFHLFFLAIRWYISGHAPWSDAYESIIYISFATILSGIAFSRNSNFSLSGAAIVGSIFLMVANLNWINPEITNLAPVLNSYWLMIHVSIITSSYGFLALSAFLGIFTLLLMIFIKRSSKSNIGNEISRIVSINERCMMIGLFLLTIGTFLGGVWANESWGRYWGWDPKETWALISIVFYSIVLHIRFISFKRFTYLFSIASIFSFYSIIMTYFGVNFYLSGLHSYAQGDPGPIPNTLYYSLIFVSLLSIISHFKYQYVYLSKDNLSKKTDLFKFSVTLIVLIFILIRSIFGLL